MSRPMKKMLKYTGIFFAVIFSIYGVKKLLFIVGMSFYQPPPATVSATKANEKKWESYLTAVSTLTAMNGVDLSTQAPGMVKEIHFNSGQLIKKDEVVILLDTSVEEANLKSARAKLQLAKMNFEREKKLHDRNVSSEALLDTRYAEYLEAQGNVESIEAQIQQKTIRAPFNGRLGIRQVNLGQFVPAGTNMVTLQALDPLYVMLNIPEQYLGDLYINQPVDVTVNIGKGKTIHGKITAINSKVNPTTRNVLVQATIPNANFALYPGMFGLAKIWLHENKNAIVIPQTAVAYSLSGDYVYVIKEQKKGKKVSFNASRQFVKVGERRENEVSIVDGLKPGDQVVTSGQLKIQNGMNVLVDNKVEM